MKSIFKKADTTIPGIEGMRDAREVINRLQAEKLVIRQEAEKAAARLSLIPAEIRGLQTILQEDTADRLLGVKKGGGRSSIQSKIDELKAEADELRAMVSSEAHELARRDNAISEAVHKLEFERKKAGVAIHRAIATEAPAGLENFIRRLVVAAQVGHNGASVFYAFSEVCRLDVSREDTMATLAEFEQEFGLID